MIYLSIALIIESKYGRGECNAWRLVSLVHPFLGGHPRWAFRNRRIFHVPEIFKGIPES